MMRPFYPLRLGLTRRRLCSMLMLLAYLVATIGLPAGNGVGNPSLGCRCDVDLKAAGGCCCKKALAGLAVSGAPSCCGAAASRSCCSSEDDLADKPAADSCCSAPQRTAADSPDYPVVSSCGCGGVPIAGFVFNADPRVVGDRTEPPCSNAWQLAPCLASPIDRGRRIAPETPPPQVPAV